MSTSKVNGLTIDELAHEAGLVVSTVRLYQNRGLLPPPVRRGRVGFYDDGHLGRLRLIGDLQERGFSLAGIKALLDGMDRGESLQAILGLGGADCGAGAGAGGDGEGGGGDGRGDGEDRDGEDGDGEDGDGEGDGGAGPGGPSTWTTERPVTMSVAELAVHLPAVELDAGLVRRTIELGLLEFTADGTHVVVRSPSFLRIGSELAALGLPPEVILDEYQKLATETALIASRFTDVFRSHLWAPFVERGMPAAEVTRLIGALEKLGPLAEAVVETSLRHALQAAAERFVDAEAARLGVAIPRPGHTGGS